MNKNIDLYSCNGQRFNNISDLFSYVHNLYYNLYTPEQFRIYFVNSLLDKSLDENNLLAAGDILDYLGVLGEGLSLKERVALLRLDIKDNAD